MQQVSRKLLLAGVLAFGTLTAACGDKVELTGPAVVPDAVQSVTVSPSNATIAPGGTVTLGVSVVTTGNAAKTVTWASGNAAIATVDGTGKVSAPAGSPGGTVSIVATSTANTAVSGAAAIVVTAPVPAQVPSIAIASVTDVFGAPVNLANTNGQVNVSVNTSGGGLIEVFVSSVCTTNTIGATDTAVASQQASSAQPGTITLSFNTAQLTASNTPRFPNGNYCIKARLTNGTATFLATNNTPVTLNNVNVFKATLAFTSVTGGPSSAVSSNNGLNYNQGTLTVTLNPVIFTSPSPVALISGILFRSGEVSGVACGACSISFTNVPVSAAGVATVVFTDTGSVAGVNSIFGYNSLATGDNLVITAATDAAGNPIAVTGGGFTVASGVRIDNDVPTLATSYAVTAPNSYIGAAYSFASGTTGTATDIKAGVPGVGGVTTTYYVGPAGGTIFNGSAATLCTITGLTAVTVGTDLPNTNSITPDQAKVVVMDALGNKSCAIVPVNSNVGSLITFGVDKVAPVIAIVPPAPANAPAGFSNNNGAADLTGYNVSKNFSLLYTDSISGFTNGVILTPLTGTLTKNFFVPGTSPIGDCVIGKWTAATKTCVDTLITPTSSLTTGANSAPFNVNSIEMTTGVPVARGATGTNGYFMFTGKVTDLAGNVSTVVSRLAAFDNVAPAIGALTQSPAAAVSLGSVTVTGTATDNLDLTASSGRLSYATAPAPFASVAGTTFGPNFDAATVTSAPASVTLSNVYRGLQGTSAGNLILAGGAAPTATITVTDVGGNTSPASPVATIATSTAKADILVGNTFVGTASVGAAPATRQTVTAINVNVTGLIADPAFQSQPFALVEVYKVVGGELVLVGSTASPLVSDAAPNRTYSYAVSGISLTAAATSTYFAIGRNAAGDAVVSQAIAVVNP
ncbi:MAG: Ig-like domain-containing protein [bacterium]